MWTTRKDVLKWEARKEAKLKTVPSGARGWGCSPPLHHHKDGRKGKECQIFNQWEHPRMECSCVGLLQNPKVEELYERGNKRTVGKATDEWKMDMGPGRHGVWIHNREERERESHS